MRSLESTGADRAMRSRQYREKHQTSGLRRRWRSWMRYEFGNTERYAIACDLCDHFPPSSNDIAQVRHCPGHRKVLKPRSSSRQERFKHSSEPPVKIAAHLLHDPRLVQARSSRSSVEPLGHFDKTMRSYFQDTGVLITRFHHRRSCESIIRPRMRSLTVTVQ